MALWTISPQEFVERLNFGSLQDFTKELHLPHIESVTQIIPLRDIKRAESMVHLSIDMVGHLIRRVKTLDGQLPFQNSLVKLTSIDSRHLLIGQRFIYREKYQAMLEEMPNVFSPFAISAGGFGNLGAYFVFGPNGNDAPSMACYLPTIIEKHGASMVIMDGIHRNYITKQMGHVLNAIVIEDVSVPFACGLRPWSEAQVIPLAQKPDRLEDRYFDLQKHLFRDLKYLGIDG